MKDGPFILYLYINLSLRSKILQKVHLKHL